jgi:hypothetical protein
MEPLKPGPLSALQQRLQYVKYMIIDEKSMVSLATLYRIDVRLREAMTSDELFGGISILLFGDFWQLPPIKDKPLFFQVYRNIPSQLAGSPIETECRPTRDGVLRDDLASYARYLQFNQSIELTVQQRQNADQTEFSAALRALRNCAVQPEHWETLSGRCRVLFCFKYIWPICNGTDYQ